MDLQYNITYRKKDKGWQYIISYKTEKIGKWKQKSKQGFSTRQEAKKSSDTGLDLLKEQLILDSEINVDFEHITFKEFKLIFLSQIKMYKAVRTIIGYETAFKAFSSLDNYKIIDITNKDIQKSIDDMTMAGLRKSSIKVYLKNIKKLFSFAKDNYKIITSLPLEDIIIKDEKEKKQKKALTLNEFYELFAKFENSHFNSYSGIILIAGTCGLRIGEILGLTWEDINFDTSIMRINKQWKAIQNKPIKYGFSELKTLNSYRHIPIPPVTMNYIINLKNSSNAFDPTNRLFEFKSTDSTIICVNKKIKEFGFDITLHELRHTYATTLISNNVDFKTAAKLLGHDVEQTMKTYSHVTDDMMKKATNLVNNIF